MKRIIKFFKKLLSNFWVRFVFLIGCIVGIFALGGAFDSVETSGEKILEIVTSVDLISVFLAAVISLIIADIVLKSRKVLEESLKIDDDHHKIVCKYHKHKKDKVDQPTGVTFYDKDGMLMYLDKLPKKRKLPKNPVRDSFSTEYARRKADGRAYVDGKLYMPSVNVFSNGAGDAKIIIKDSTDKYILPQFVSENALLLMEAHATSNVANSVTVRLNDANYADGTLTLDTCRSQYYDMLITNRCMDYALNDAVTVRKLYEHGDSVSPLFSSQLCNQIGVNGLIFSNDGYLLLEKRGRKKTTWKNKFAQPISLALKLSDIEVNADGKIGADEAAAQKCFKDVILKTLGKNFGIKESDLRGFDMQTNFMGLARDLLEGGKPNMYFYVTVDKPAEELAKLLNDRAKHASFVGSSDEKIMKKAKKRGMQPEKKPEPQLTREKLDSAFYLARYSDININYKYELKLKARDVIRLHRRHAPRVSRGVGATDGFGYRLKRAFGGSIKRECGEALLACLYFADVCPRVTAFSQGAQRNETVRS